MPANSIVEDYSDIASRLRELTGGSPERMDINHLILRTSEHAPGWYVSCDSPTWEGEIKDLIERGKGSWKWVILVPDENAAYVGPLPAEPSDAMKAKYRLRLVQTP